MDEQNNKRDAELRHKKIFRGVYEFLEQHYPPANTDEYWHKFALDVNIAGQDLGNDELALDMLVAVGKYMEREVKGERE